MKRGEEEMTGIKIFSVGAGDFNQMDGEGREEGFSLFEFGNI